MARETVNLARGGQEAPRRSPARPARPGSPLRVVPAGEGVQTLNTPPPGRRLDLGRRGRTWIREEAGPAGAPTLLMLHGLGATGGLNWSGSQLFLRDQFNIVTIDHRGHGRGIRTRDFHLEDCADDAAAVIDALGLDRPIAVGYSMGGPIASLLWRRHPEKVGGLVFCATSRNFRGTPGEKLALGTMGMMGLSPMLLPERVVRGAGRVIRRLPVPHPASVHEVQWAIEEMAGHDPRSVLQAAGAIGQFNSSSWIGGVDVPTAVVVTTSDQIVPAIRQFRLARSIPHASVHCIDAGHLCVAGGDPKVRFLTTLRRACLEVSADH
ncbi:MAG TPA: alpha/beta fold hydrolase [Acidimicrobiales bacterium]|nr:alpha/beta fold hydrolase [Acidimicrobiales bacterium]